MNPLNKPVIERCSLSIVLQAIKAIVARSNWIAGSLIVKTKRKEGTITRPEVLTGK